MNELKHTCYSNPLQLPRCAACDAEAATRPPLTETLRHLNNPDQHFWDWWTWKLDNEMKGRKQ
jgi:hypothetical protein